MLNDELYKLNKKVPFTVYWCKISCQEFNKDGDFDCHNNKSVGYKLTQLKV